MATLQNKLIIFLKYIAAVISLYVLLLQFLFYFYGPLYNHYTIVAQLISAGQTTLLLVWPAEMSWATWNYYCFFFTVLHQTALPRLSYQRL